MSKLRSLEEKTAAVYTILSEVYSQSPWSERQILADMEQDNVDYFFVEADRRIIGFLSVQQLVGELEITNIAVTEPYQGRGLGRQLMNYLTNVDCPIFLEVRNSNQSAQTLYKKFGFEVIGRRKNYYHEPIEDAIVMKREGSEN